MGKHINSFGGSISGPVLQQEGRGQKAGGRKVVEVDEEAAHHHPPGKEAGIVPAANMTRERDADQELKSGQADVR